MGFVFLLAVFVFGFKIGISHNILLFINLDGNSD